jgi:hypothetical protein
MLAGATSGKGGFESLATNDTTQLNLNYRDSLLNGKGLVTQSGLQAGDRAPDARLADGTWLSEQLRGPQWKLVVFGQQQPGNISDRVKIIKSEDEIVIKTYGSTDGAVLIRPDGYIALIAASADEVANYFQTLNIY